MHQLVVKRFQLCVPLPLIFKKSTPCPKLKSVVLWFSDDTQLFVPKGDKRSARPEILTAVLLKMQAFGTWRCDLGQAVLNILKEHSVFIFKIKQSQKSRQYAWTTGPWWWRYYAPSKCQELTTHTRVCGGVVVKALCYKPPGRGFDSRWCHWNFSVT